MTKKNSTKRSLILSALSLLLCFSMLIGTTFAWFTDEVSSKNNIIKAGNLDIELYYQNDETAKTSDPWVKVTADTNVFKEETLWEPGHTEVVKLKVVNEGTLALKYQLGINVESEITSTNVLGAELKLSDHIKYGVVDGDQNYTRETAVAAAEAKATKLNVTYGSGTIELAPKAEKIVTMVVYMPTSVGNEANAAKDAKTPTINLGINLFATQLANEEDSFGPDYDEDAWHNSMKVYDADDLQTALDSGAKDIVIVNDIISENGFKISADQPIAYSTRATSDEIVIDLNGHTLTATGSRAYLFEVTGNASVTILNGKLVAESTNGQVDGTGASTGASSSIRFSSTGTLTLKNVEIQGSVRGGHRAIDVYGGKAILTNVDITTAYGAGIVIGGEGVSAELNNCDITVNGMYSAPYNSVCFGVWGGAEMTVNSGNYKMINDKTYATGDTHGGWVAIVMSSGGTLNINGGVYTNVPAEGFNPAYERAIFELENNSPAVSTLNLVGGTFIPQEDQIYGGYGDKYYPTYNVTNLVEYTEGTWVAVPEGVAEENVVDTSDELKAALSGAGSAGAGDTTIFIAGDIDLTGTTWTPINVDGYHGADVVTIEGNGATIKGLTAPLFHGGFAGGSGIVIKDLTIADSNIVSTNKTGSGAFIEYVDSMDVITLVNCHLINSTVSGSRTGGLIGYTTGYNNVNDGAVKTYITIKNCSIDGCKIYGTGTTGGFVGQSGANEWTYTKILNSTISNTEIKTEDASKGAGIYVGTANVGETTITACNYANITGATELCGRYSFGTTGKLIINGTKILANVTNESLSDALASGDADLYVPAGEYNMPSSGSTGEIKITGTKDTVLNMTNGAYLEGANVTIEGVTIKTGTGKVNGNGSDYAALYTSNVTYIDCTFVGPMRVGRDGAKFINCTFTELGNDYVWTYGNDVTFEGCTFNTAGKAILIYSDGGNEVAEVTVKNCTFNSTAGAKAGAIANQNCAAIEIHNYGNGVNLVTEGNTYDSNFSGEWRIKTYESGRTKVFVNGTEYTTIAIDGKTMTIDANKNVTVNG